MTTRLQRQADTLTYKEKAIPIAGQATLSISNQPSLCLHLNFQFSTLDSYCRSHVELDKRTLEMETSSLTCEHFGTHSYAYICTTCSFGIGVLSSGR